MIERHVCAWGEETDARLSERQRLVFETVNTVVRRYVNRLPVDVERICALCGVELLRLSDYEAKGFTAQEMETVWGNPDGAASFGAGHPVIGYNDRAPARRLRFTLAEELMHVLLGHVHDPRFNAFSQDYDPALYALYEAEAKRAAGMLLFPPALYYAHRRSASLAQLARICRVSKACAWTCARDYEANETLLREVFTAKRLDYARPRSPRAAAAPRDVWAEPRELL